MRAYIAVIFVAVLLGLLAWSCAAPQRQAGAGQQQRGLGNAAGQFNPASAPASAPSAQQQATGGLAANTALVFQYGISGTAALVLMLFLVLWYRRERARDQAQAVQDRSDTAGIFNLVRIMAGLLYRSWPRREDKS